MVEVTSEVMADKVEKEGMTLTLHRKHTSGEWVAVILLGEEVWARISHKSRHQAMGEAVERMEAFLASVYGPPTLEDLGHIVAVDPNGEY